jgi:hypothetical protein
VVRECEQSSDTPRGEKKVPKFEAVPLAEVKTRISPELQALVEQAKEDLEKLRPDQAGRYKLEKGDEAKSLRKAVKLAAASLNRSVRFPRRGEEGVLSFYLDAGRRRRGRPPKTEAAPVGPRRRGRPRKTGG